MGNGLAQITQLVEATEKAANLPGLEGVLSLLVVGMVAALIYAQKRAWEAQAKAQEALMRVVQANTETFATQAAKFEHMAHEQEEVRKSLDAMQQTVTNTALLCAKSNDSHH